MVGVRMKRALTGLVLVSACLAVGLLVRFWSSQRRALMYPMENVYWSFWEPKSANYEDFVAAVTRYNSELSASSDWEPERVISTKPMRVLYAPMWLLPQHHVDLMVGEAGKSVTMGLLLFTLHHELHALYADANDHFFEGLERVGENTYRIMTGS